MPTESRWRSESEDLVGSLPSVFVHILADVNFSGWEEAEVTICGSSTRLPE
jgi:hypothetical protein